MFPTEFLRLIAIVVKANICGGFALDCEENIPSDSTNLFPNSRHQFLQVDTRSYNCKN